jgi:FkbM family methyltransferase
MSIAVSNSGRLQQTFARMRKRGRCFEELLQLSRTLHLDLRSTANLLASHYVSRLGPLRAVCPSLLEVHVPSRDLRIPLRPNGVDHTLLHEIFVAEEYYFEARQVRTILDVGANIGVAALYLHTAFPDAAIACVEPVPDNLRVLRKTLQWNRVPARIFEAAIGVQDGTAQLHLGASPTVHSLVYSAGGKTLETPQISVPTVMAEMGWPTLDVLKIDIEGYEQVLFSEKNAWLSRVRIIAGETHGSYGTPELTRDLAPYGFEVQERFRHPVFGTTIFRATNNS